MVAFASIQHSSHLSSVMVLELTMASLSIRKLDDETLSRLQPPAAAYGLVLERFSALWSFTQWVSGG
jgi:hypothetical protein